MKFLMCDRADGSEDDPDQNDGDADDATPGASVEPAPDEAE